jgi:hypothetical protein
VFVADAERTATLYRRAPVLGREEHLTEDVWAQASTFSQHAPQRFMALATRTAAYPTLRAADAGMKQARPTFLTNLPLLEEVSPEVTM